MIATISPFTSTLTKGLTVEKATFETTRLLVEQGSNELSTKLDRSSFRVKMVLWLYFIVAVILLNAYKNTNVYNMTKPRILMPYIC